VVWSLATNNLSFDFISSCLWSKSFDLIIKIDFLIFLDII